MDPRSLPLVRKLPGLGEATRLVLEIDLGAGVQEDPPQDPVSALRRRNVPLLRDVLEGLRLAAEDDDVVAVALLGSADALTPAQADEVGAAIDAVRQKGKATYAHAATYGELGDGTVPYALAARCEHVWLQPSGQVGLTGVASTMMVARPALAKLGVEPQFSKRHEYKTAADLFAADTISDPAREMASRLATSVTEQLTAIVADRRELAASLDDLLAKAPLQAAEALEHRLVDRLGHRDELDEAIDAAHPDAERRFVHRYARRAAKPSPAQKLQRRKAPQVAVVPVRGAIVSGRSRPAGPGPAGPRAGGDTVVAALRDAARNDRVKAVVLRVDSPGGSYVASDAIRHAVLAVRRSGRPVVASMGTVAASGGYFAAMPADRVFASPTTITGSIGVLAGKFVISELAARVGLVREVAPAGPNAALLSPDVPFTDAQRARFESWLDDVYRDFTTKAAEDRGMPYDELEALARGRVWTGADAAQRGLVDELGGQDAAVAHACRLAKIDRDDAELVAWPPLGLLDRLKPAESSQSPSAALALAHAAPASLDDWLAVAADAVGLPAGVLALPFPVRLR